MRPHAATNKKATGLARARMLMKAKLGWLEGYPSAQGWVVVPQQGEPPEAPLVLTRDHLRRATYAANKLCGEFPRALPVLVGDVDAWRGAVSEVLAAIKPSVHHGQALPGELFGATTIHSRTARARASALTREHPALRGLVEALSWVLATRAASAAKALAWVEREAAALTLMHEQLEPEVARTLGVQCVHLAALVGPKAPAPLMRLLGEPSIYCTPTHAAAGFCQEADAMLQHPGRPAPPEPEVGLPEGLAGAVRWLLAQDSATAKRWLTLLERCDPLPVVHEWVEWWPPMRKLVSHGHSIRNHEDDTPQRKRKLASLRQQIVALRRRKPGELPLPVLLESLRPLAESGFGDGHAPAGRVLTRPELAILRAGLAIQWGYLHASPHAWWSPRRLPVLLRASDEFLRGRPVTSARLSPWYDDACGIAARGRGGSSIDQDLLEPAELELADIGRFFQALRWLEAHAPAIELGNVTDAVVRQLEALHDAELAARLAVVLYEAEHHDTWISTATLRAAWRVCAPEPAGYAAVVQALERIQSETGLSPEALVDGMGSALGRGPLPLLRALLLDADLGPLVQCGRKLAVLHALGDPLRPPPSSSAGAREWIASYPAALHDDLAWLCDQTPQAEALAAKLLRSIHHGAAAIDDERRAVERLLQEASAERRGALETRLRTLARRQAEPALTPSPAKLERLRAKLRRRGALARLAALEDAADALLPGAVARELGFERAPAWALEERVLALLVPLRRLSAPLRQLARTIMRARDGTPPWDLREHPANAAFLATLTARGVEVGPWLDGIGTIEVGHGNARMRLSLEDDPLEVFHMGRHFGTCLSPGQCNFFSVFANAADVNKRVLYARDARGRVLGRRLLCLTAEGSVLAFHAYCHDRTAGFEEHSVAFARDLAEAMGTTVVGRATVPLLLASDWYDDGPVDIAGQFAALEEGSAFRQALAQTAPAELPGLVLEAFGRPKLDEVLAPMVLALPELGGRSELALALLAVIRHPERLPLRGCQQLVWMLSHAGAAARARELLAEPMAAALWQQHREHESMDVYAVEALAQLAPGRALGLLKRTRARGIRSWDAESEVGRLYAAGVAMEGLRRPAQAVRMYERAQAADRSGHFEKRARARLSALA